MSHATVFYLHGGFRPGKGEHNEFFSAVLADAPREARILLVMFAKEALRVSRNVEETKRNFLNNAYGRVLEFEVATRESFLNQIEPADVVYFHGGLTELINNELASLPKFGNRLSGKVVVGDSAGGNALAAFGYSLHAKKFFVGSGVLDLVFVPHYVVDQAIKIPDAAMGLPVVKLPEFSFRRIVVTT